MYRLDVAPRGIVREVAPTLSVDSSLDNVQGVQDSFTRKVDCNVAMLMTGLVLVDFSNWLCHSADHRASIARCE